MVITDTTLCRPARGVVVHSPTSELVSASIIAAKWNCHFDNSSRGDDRFDQAVFQFQPLASLANTEFGCFERRVVLI